MDRETEDLVVECLHASHVLAQTVFSGMFDNRLGHFRVVEQALDQVIAAQQAERLDGAPIVPFRRVK